MYLSRLKIDLGDGAGMAVAADAYSAHQFIYAAFVDAIAARPLYRRESGMDGVAFIVQSKTAPDWARAMGQRRVKAQWSAKEYARPSLAKDARFRFRLLANVVKTMKSDKAPKPGNEPKRARVPIMKDDALLEWLDAEGAKHGFAIDSASIRGRDTIETRRHGIPEAKSIILASTLFEGAISVVDPDQLWTAVELGLGHGKGFGLGLLSIAPIGQDASKP
jgi:CRISPR system Cascade subunit CasE